MLQRIHQLNVVVEVDSDMLATAHVGGNERNKKIDICCCSFYPNTCIIQDLGFLCTS